jgi:peptide/nickel transport system substrate-binding protein
MMTLPRQGIAACVLAVVAATGLAACSGSSGGGVKLSSSGQYPESYGSVPAASGTPRSGGTVTVGETVGNTPTWILPIITGSEDTIFNLNYFEYLFWPALYNQGGVQPVIDEATSPADPPQWSNGDKTVSITLKSSWKWSDGTPISAKDLEFTIDEIVAAVRSSAANWTDYVPGGFPDTLVSMTTQGSQTLVINLKAPVNPSWFEEDILTNVDPMPSAQWARASASGPILDFTNPANAAKIYAYLSSQSQQLSGYASSPLWQTVDGPYRLTAFNAATGAYTMVPNPDYGGPHPGKLTVQLVPFTSLTAEFNAERAGTLDVGYVPPEDVPEVPTLQRAGYDAFGYPDFGYSSIFWNFADKTGDFNNVIGQVYVRQALAHLEDQQGQIHAFFDGAGVPGYSTVPPVPASPFIPADARTNPFAFSVSAAVALLKDHGWTVKPGATDVCAKAGTGTGECGAGIPQGTRLAFNIIYDNTPAAIGLMDDDLASEAKKAGIEITLVSGSFNTIVTDYNDQNAPANNNKWAALNFGLNGSDLYPTTYGQFNSDASGDFNDYSSPTADQLIQASITSPNPDAVRNELSFLTENQPVLFQPQPDNIYVWKKDLSGTPDSFANMTQNLLTPQFWYFVK